MKIKSKSSIITCVCLLILITVILLAGLKFYNNYKEIKNLERQITLMNEKIEQACKENIELEKKLKKIDDDEYVEKIAREELGLVKPGEVLLVPVTEKESDE